MPFLFFVITSTCEWSETVSILCLVSWRFGNTMQSPY